MVGVVVVVVVVVVMVSWLPLTCATPLLTRRREPGDTSDPKPLNHLVERHGFEAAQREEPVDVAHDNGSIVEAIFAASVQLMWYHFLQDCTTEG